MARSDHNLYLDNDTPCPDYPGDGLCLAKTAQGAASGGIPLHTVLVCEFDDADVLLTPVVGEPPVPVGKWRGKGALRTTVGMTALCPLIAISTAALPTA